ncbi:MAG: U32 family peptidase [Oscillospiraceae bacterium]|nr:U32 family peptidase [Oscillospiraceae bacterium]
MSFGGCEVLAPAGRMSDIAPLLEVGADAIYVGLSGYSARPESSDFSVGEIEEALGIIHGAGKKLFVAVNANVEGERIDELCELIKKLDKMGADAIIIADYGLIYRVSEFIENAELHASTLSGTYNAEDVRLLCDMGVRRIILSSDLYVDEIADIIDRVPEADYEIVADGGICFNSNRQCLLPHFGQKECYNVYCQKEYELLLSGKSLGRAKRIGNYPGKLHRTMGIYLGMGISSFKIEGRTNDFGYILQRVKDVVSSKKFFLEHLREIPGMMHYIRRSNWYGERR